MKMFKEEKINKENESRRNKKEFDALYDMMVNFLTDGLIWLGSKLFRKF